MTTFLGIDIGIRTVNPTACVILDGTDWAVQHVQIICPNDKTMPDRYDRVDWIGYHLQAVIEHHKPSVIGYEIPYVGHDPQVAIIFGHIGGIIRAAAYRFGIPAYSIPAAVIKMYTAGNGQADKEAMISAAAEKFWINLESFRSVLLKGRKAPIDMASHVADGAGAAYSAAILDGARTN